MRRYGLVILFTILTIIGLSWTNPKSQSLSHQQKQRTSSLHVKNLDALVFTVGTIQFGLPSDPLQIKSKMLSSRTASTSTTTTTTVKAPLPQLTPQPQPIQTAPPVPVSTPSTPPVTTAPPSAVASTVTTDGVTDAERAAWSKVNVCEEGGNWHVQGGLYEGGLGINVTNWASYGGLQDFGPEWSASPDQQIIVAMRIEGNGYVPDQNGCSGGW